MQKGKIAKILIPIAIFLLAIVAVNAQSFQMPEIITDAITWVFETLPALPADEKIVYLKFFIWIPIYAIFYFLLTKFTRQGREGAEPAFFASHHKTGNIVAFALSLISVAFIPNGIVEAIVMTYSLILGFVIPGAIIIAVMSFARSSDNEFVKGFIYFLTFFVLLWFNTAIRNSGGDFAPIYDRHISDWIELVALLCFILFFIALLKAFGSVFGSGESEIVTPMARSLNESPDYQATKSNVGWLLSGGRETRQAMRQEQIAQMSEYLAVQEIRKEEEMITYLENFKAQLDKLNEGLLGGRVPLEYVDQQTRALAPYLEKVLAANNGILSNEKKLQRFDQQLMQWQRRITANMIRYKKQIHDSNVLRLISEVESDSYQLFKEERYAKKVINNIMALENDFVKEIQAAMGALRISPAGDARARTREGKKHIDAAIIKKKEALVELTKVKVMLEKVQNLELRVLDLEKKAAAELARQQAQAPNA